MSLDLVANVGDAHGGSLEKKRNEGGLRVRGLRRAWGPREEKNKEARVEGASASMEVCEAPPKGVMCSWFAWGMVEREATHMPHLG